MATARVTLGSVLATVQTSANTVTNVLGAANSSVGMLNRFITDAADKQNVRSKVDMAMFKEQLTRDKAEEEAVSELRVIDFCKQSQNHASAYQKSYDRLSAIIATE